MPTKKPRKRRLSKAAIRYQASMRRKQQARRRQIAKKANARRAAKKRKLVVARKQRLFRERAGLLIVSGNGAGASGFGYTQPLASSPPGVQGEHVMHGSFHPKEEAPNV